MDTKMNLCEACKKQCNLYRKHPDQIVVDCGRFDPDKDKPELLAELVMQNWRTAGGDKK